VLVREAGLVRDEMESTMSPPEATEVGEATEAVMDFLVHVVSDGCGPCVVCLFVCLFVCVCVCVCVCLCVCEGIA
jgi:hypothetical protein